MQDLIRKLSGVVSTRVGYTGGDTPNATHRNHGTHAEGIEIVFDTAETSYRRILEYFFQIHDPTTRSRQGNDIGASYRSAIFYTSDEQRKVAEETIADVNASGLWPGQVVTEVTPVGDFWEAEPEHQDYLERYPNGYTCHFPRPNWVLPKRDTTGKPTETPAHAGVDARSQNAVRLRSLSFSSRSRHLLAAAVPTVMREIHPPYRYRYGVLRHRRG